MSEKDMLRYICRVRGKIVLFHKPIGKWNGVIHLSLGEYISTFTEIYNI